MQRRVRFKKPGDLPTTVVRPEARPQKMEFWLTAEQAAFVQQALDHAKRKAGGTLTITVIADPDAVPDLPDLAAALRAELDGLTVVHAAPRRQRPEGHDDVRDELGGRPG